MTDNERCDIERAHSSLNIPKVFQPYLTCPGNPLVKLQAHESFLKPLGKIKNIQFPIINGVPILINEKNSIFRISDFLSKEQEHTNYYHAEKPDFAQHISDLLRKITPEKTRNVCKFSANDAIKIITKEYQDARILIIGAGQKIYTHANPNNTIYSDIIFSKKINIICDAHEIPFCNDTFDAVIAVAVLEHVANPYECVDEIRRVLKPNGRVYAATPFLQQVHMGKFDFTRFTALGHRRLFRWFNEERSGIANGPGTVMSWSTESFFACMSENPSMRRYLRTIGRFVGRPFLLFDKWLSIKKGAYDCSSAYYFFGNLRDEPISDREIINKYQGLL